MQYTVSHYSTITVVKHQVSALRERTLTVGKRSRTSRVPSFNSLVDIAYHQLLAASNESQGFRRNINYRWERLTNTQAGLKLIGHVYSTRTRASMGYK